MSRQRIFSLYAPRVILHSQQVRVPVVDDRPALIITQNGRDQEVHNISIRTLVL